MNLFYRTLLTNHFLSPKFFIIFFLITSSFYSCSTPYFTDADEPIRHGIASAKAYYLSKDGDDANPGSKERPWRTLEKLNSIDLEPGETVFLEGGVVFQGTLVLEPIDSGSEGKHVVITSYGPGVATVDGGFKEAAIIKSSFFTVKSINVKGAGRKEGNTSNGIKAEKARNGAIEEVTTEGFQQSGLLLYSCRNVKAIKVVARNNGFSGIYVTGDWAERNGKYLFPDNDEDCSRNITLKDCVAENNPGNPTILDNHSGNGILIEFTKGALVDRCTATNNGWDMPRSGNGPIGIWATSSDSITIQHCISYRNKTSSNGQDGGGFDFDGGITNSVIQYCLSYENEGAGYGLYQWDGAMDWSNNIIRYSVSINDGIKAYGAFTIWNGPNEAKQLRNGKIYNNIVYNNISPVVKFITASKHEDFSFYNNIFIGKGDLITGPSSGDKFLGNTYWNIDGTYVSFRGHSSLQAWADATGQEKLEGRLAGLFANPLLTGPFTTNLTDPYQLGTLTGFKLQPNSPVKDKGLDLQTLFKLKMPGQDFYGKPAFRGTAPEPGVHEME